MTFEKPVGVSGVVKFDAEKYRWFGKSGGQCYKLYIAGGQVTVSLAEDSDKIKISVTDTGIGIAAEDLPQLFSKFFRLDSAVKMVPNHRFGFVYF